MWGWGHGVPQRKQWCRVLASRLPPLQSPLRGSMLCAVQDGVRCQRTEMRARGRCRQVKSGRRLLYLRRAHLQPLVRK